MNQVESTLHTLHEAGIIWGDAKLANVLIDSNQDAWIIDFGGGYTTGWVDREKAGTIEGQPGTVEDQRTPAVDNN